MKYAPLLLVLASGGLLGWFAPDPSERQHSAESRAEETAGDNDKQSGVLRQNQWNAGAVVLPRAPDGHFYADVSVGGSSARMLVDTGASVVALTAEDADALGVTWNEADIGPVAKGANGTVYGIATRLEHVQLGEIHARGVDAVVVPEGLPYSLLGQSFLSRAGRIEMDQDRMTLGG